MSESECNHDAMFRRMAATTDKLDGLSDLFTDVIGQFKPPRIVVLGDEKAGKSTLLESLVGYSIFPRDCMTCTRMAIYIRLRRIYSGAASCTMSVEPMYGHGEKFVAADHETQSINLDDHTSDVVKKRMDDLCKGEFVSDKRLCLDIKAPGVPPVDFYELPGFRQVPESDAKHVREIVRQVREEETRLGMKSLYFVICNENPANSFALKYVVDEGLGPTAFGVINKCDKFDSKEVLYSVVTGVPLRGSAAATVGHIPLNRGWTATMVKQLDPQRGKQGKKGKDQEKGQRIIRTLQEEQDFFRSGDDSLQKLHREGKAGVPALGRTMAVSYNEYLRTTWLEPLLFKLFGLLEKEQFDLTMLGQDEAKAQAMLPKEVKRRLTDRRLAGLQTRTLSKVIVNWLRPKLKEVLDRHQTQKAIPAQELDSRIRQLSKEVSNCVDGCLKELEAVWSEVETLLRAKIVMEEAPEEKEEEVSESRGWLVTLFTRQKKREVQKQVVQEPFLQLSNYTECTNAMVKKFKVVLKDRVEKLRTDAMEVACELLRPCNNHFLSFKTTESAETIDWTINTVSLMATIEVVFLRHLPRAEDFSELHCDIQIGFEDAANIQRREQISGQIKKHQDAKQGIMEALNLTDEDMADNWSKYDQLEK